MDRPATQVKMESALELTAAAIQRLLDQKVALNLPNLQIPTLAGFLAAAKQTPLQLSEREIICEQAILILEQFYAHLPFKRARYGIDPVQRLRLMRARLPLFPDDLKFHRELIQIFTELRDAHTLYGLPAPYRGALAFLPFIMKSFADDSGVVHFVVTQTLNGFTHPDFKPGVEVTGWNGMSVMRAVEQLAWAIPAGNDASKFSRGMARLTTRSLTYGLPPAEESVFIQYTPDNGETAAEQNILMFPWYVATGFPEGAFRAPATAVCQPVADQASARNALWGEQPWKEQEDLQQREETEATARQHLGEAPIFSSLDAVPASFHSDATAFLYSKLPNVFEFQHPSGLIIRRSITPDELCNPDDPDTKRFGYIRIKTFESHPDSIFNEFERILRVMNEFAPDGLILDVRGNPGGSINGAERILQLLTPREITPASFHFANTPVIQAILASVRTLSSRDIDTQLKILRLQEEFKPWIDDASSALAEGLPVTEGRPLTSHSSANDTGQVYYGPVVLVTDAVSYSATDIFTAGFQDHEIGEIIGVDENTGGGGASRWWHQDDLFERLDILPDLPLKQLPSGAAIAFACLRSSRSGRRAGQSLEDVGVVRSIPYQLTKTDIMDWGSDLVRFACRQLALKPVYKLEVTSAIIRDEAIEINLRSNNLVRVVCFVNGIPQFSGSASVDTLSVPLDGLDPAKVNQVEVRGYARPEAPPTGVGTVSLQLVAAARCPLPIAKAVTGSSA